MRTFKLLVLSILATVLAGAWTVAVADADTEAFVEKNANRLLNLLDDDTIDAATRTTTFVGYMDEFSNVDRIAAFVIGKYSRRFSTEELAAYRSAFRFLSKHDLSELLANFRFGLP